MYKDIVIALRCWEGVTTPCKGCRYFHNDSCNRSREQIAGESADIIEYLEGELLRVTNENFLIQTRCWELKKIIDEHDNKKLQELNKEIERLKGLYPYRKESEEDNDKRRSD